MTLVADWTLQEDSGTTAYDHTGNNHDGTVNGATLGATGLLGTTAYSFDGTDDYVSLPSTPFQFGSGEFTLTAWVKHASTGSDQAIIRGDDTDGSSDVIVLRGDSTDVWKFQTRSDTGGDLASADSTTGITTGTWFFIVGVREGDGTLRIYVDAVEEGTASGTTGTVSTSDVYMGANQGNTTNYLDGDLTDVRVYDRSLTPVEIQYLYDVSTRGVIYTATKTHGSTVQPDITNATFTLNGESATVWVIGSPRTSSEETQSADLVSGTTEYDLTWSSGHTDFAIMVEADIADVTNRVEVDKIGLKA